MLLWTQLKIAATKLATQLKNKFKNNLLYVEDECTKYDTNYVTV